MDRMGEEKQVKIPSKPARNVGHGMKLEEVKGVLLSIPFDSMLEMFGEDKRDAVRKLWDAPGIRGLVLFVNDDPNSIERGSVAAVKIGPNEKIKTFDECEGKFIGDPPDAKIALYYCVKS